MYRSCSREQCSVQHDITLLFRGSISATSPPSLYTWTLHRCSWLGLKLKLCIIWAAEHQRLSLSSLKPRSDFMNMGTKLQFPTLQIPDMRHVSRMTHMSFRDRSEYIVLCNFPTDLPLFLFPNIALPFIHNQSNTASLALQIMQFACLKKV